MTREDYCSYEVAKLLKEKGFDGDGGDAECHMFYSNYTEEEIMPIMEIGLVPYDEACFAPTHQMAMKWLREKYDLHIIVYPYKADYKENVSTKWCCVVYKTYNQLGCEKYTNETLNSYEEAVEAALRYSLEILI